MIKTFEEYNNIIPPTRVGQIVKFHSPFPDEDPNQEYIIKEIDPPRALIEAINTKMNLAPTDRVPIKDLTVIRDKK